MEVVQYYGGCSVHWRLFSTSGGKHQYCGGIASVLWGDSFSTVEVVQYSGGLLQYCGRLFSTGGDTSVHAGG